MQKKADGLIDLIWDDNVGPVENILGLAEYGLVFIPGMRITTIIMAALGLGPKRFGKWIDQKFGLKTVGDVEAKFENPEQVSKKILDSVVNELETQGSLNFPLSTKTLKKEALSSRTKFLHSLKREMRKGTAVGLLAKAILGITKWAKIITLGGLGAISLKSIRSLEDKEEPGRAKTAPDIPVSIKEKPNRVRDSLEKEIDIALSM